jgi:tetratricopeptide (TPR) repeat protein
MGNVFEFPIEKSLGYEQVKARYTAQELRTLFGLQEKMLRRWIDEHLIEPVERTPELVFDFTALPILRRVRELRAAGNTLQRIEDELRGQLNLFDRSKSPAVVIDIKSRESAFRRALLCQDRDPEAARTLYNESIKAGAYQADAYCNLGLLEYQSGRSLKAISCLAQGLQHDPQHIELHYNLGSIYYDLGDHPLARKHLELVREIEPSYPCAHFNLALVYGKLGDLAGAFNSLRVYRALLTEPDGEVEALLAKVDGCEFSLIPSD